MSKHRDVPPHHDQAARDDDRPDVVDRLCPGPCNRRYLAASRAAAAELHAAHDEDRDADPRIVEHRAKPSPAQPVWCRPCQTRILSAIGRLPDLAAALFEHTALMGDAEAHDLAPFLHRAIVGHDWTTAPDPIPGRTGLPFTSVPVWVLDCGHQLVVRHVPTTGDVACIACLAVTWVGAGKLAEGARTDGGSAGKRIVSPSGSPAWDAIDELVSFACDLEDRLRDELGHGHSGRTYRSGSAIARTAHLSTSVGYLTTWGTALLSLPTAEADGRRALRLERAAEEAAGEDRLVHSLPVPCPRCDRKALVRDDGSDQVDCKACGSSWPEDSYRRLVLVLADEWKRDQKGA